MWCTVYQYYIDKRGNYWSILPTDIYICIYNIIDMIWYIMNITWYGQNQLISSTQSSYNITHHMIWYDVSWISCDTSSTRNGQIQLIKHPIHISYHISHDTIWNDISWISCDMIFHVSYHMSRFFSYHITYPTLVISFHSWHRPLT